MLILRATAVLNSGWIASIHRARRGPQSLSGGSIPVGRRDIEAFPFPRPLAGAQSPRAQAGALSLVTEFDNAATTLAGGRGGNERGIEEVLGAILMRIPTSPPGEMGSPK